MYSPFKMKGHTLPGPMQKKFNPFSAESKRMTATEKRAAQDADPTFKGTKQTTGDKLKAAKSKAISRVSKVGKDARNVLDKLDAGVQDFFGNPRSTTADQIREQRGSGDGDSSKGYTKMKSVNALVSDRKKWQTKNPNKKYPGQAEINKRLKKNPNKWD
tara:strand:+ start:317 stop:793 length:477 start_codon:yes stop_codon:yes gene_type:complete